MASGKWLRVPYPADGIVMDSDHSVKEAIRVALHQAGACRVGFAAAEPIDQKVAASYAAWITGGNHGEMNYLDRYHDVRNDPRLLLDGARTIISCAFDYRPSLRHPLFADYSLGLDYHEVIRQRLAPVTEYLCRRFGGQMRICVDTAPIRERYWAARAGVGIIGLNGLLIVDGVGSKVFLAEIIWTEEVSPDLSRLGESCKQCGACLRACPGKALKGDCTLDARRCNSYLTIEYRGELPDDLKLPGRIYGCDICQDVCPHNRTAGTTSLTEFTPSDALLRLDTEAISRLTPETFNQIFRHSAVRRTKLSGLLRNLQKNQK